MKIGILGGGLAGLTLGASLPSSEILESEGTCGGLLKSRTADGFTFDCHGSHILFSKEAKALSFITAALGDNVLQVERDAKIYIDRRFVKYPIENGLSGLSLSENFGVLASYSKARLKESLKKETPRNFDEWIRQRFGDELAELYLLPYNEKLWKRKPSELEWEWAEKRLPQPRYLDVLRASLGLASEGYMHQKLFRYPRRGGIEALADALERKASTRIVKNFRVTSVRKRGLKWVVSDGKRSREYDWLISTIPIDELIPAIENAPKEVKIASRQLETTALVTVMVGFEAKNRHFPTWLYVPEKESGPFNRIGFPSVINKENAPVGFASLCAEITCHVGDKMWRDRDFEIIRKTVADIEKIGILNQKSVVFSSVARADHAYPVYRIGNRKALERVKEFAQESGILLCGRFAEFDYKNMDVVIKDALKSARKMRMKAVHQ